jgi:hypothetical protein
MRVKHGDRVILDVRAKAEPAESVVTDDYYTQLPQIRLSPNPTSRQAHPETPTEVTLDDTDVVKLLEAALRHPVFNMRQAVLAAIWNHPETVRQIFRFGLTAAAAFTEIREIVAEELANHALAAKSPASNQAGSTRDILLPRMPVPPHLRAIRAKSTGRTE